MEQTGMMIDRFQAEMSGTTKLFLEDAAPYITVVSIVVGDLAQGDMVQVYGEAHGNPLQNNQTENAWVTGISILDESNNVIDIPCFYRGQDLEKNRKNHDCRIGTYSCDMAMTNVKIEFRMRAVNKYAGGYFEVMKAKLGCLVFRAGQS